MHVRIPSFLAPLTITDNLVSLTTSSFVALRIRTHDYKDDRDKCSSVMISAKQNVVSIRQVKRAICSNHETATSIATDYLRAARELNPCLNAFNTFSTEIIIEANLLDVSHGDLKILIVWR